MCTFVCVTRLCVSYIHRQVFVGSCCSSYIGGMVLGVSNGDFVAGALESGAHWSEVEEEDMGLKRPKWRRV